MTVQGHDLKVSLLTPVGTGAIAVVRLIGHGVRATMTHWFQPNGGATPKWVSSDRLSLGRFLDREEVVDEVIVSAGTDGPDGEVVEISAHGGVRVVERIMQTFSRLGAKFDSEPADVPGRCTFIEAEAVRALARAKTRRAVRFVAHQRMVLPAALEELARTCDRNPAGGSAELAAMHGRSQTAPFLVEGATVAVLGPPNAGKSTLINRLFDAGQNLVSSLAGTTRDWVETETALNGIPLTVIDTAGIADPSDEIEREAIRRGLARCREADVRVVVVDGSVPPPAGFEERVAPLVNAGRSIVVVNKSDLPAASNDPPGVALGEPIVGTSGLSGAGVAELRLQLGMILSGGQTGSGKPLLFTSNLLRWVERALSDLPPAALRAAICGQLLGPVA